MIIISLSLIYGFSYVRPIFSEITCDSQILVCSPASSPIYILRFPILHLYNIYYLFTDLGFFFNLWSNVKLFVTFFSGTTEYSYLIFCIQPKLKVPFCAYPFHTWVTPTFFLPTYISS